MQIPEVRVFGYLYENKEAFSFSLHAVIDFRGKRFQIAIKTDEQYAICEVDKDSLKPVGNLIYLNKEKLHKEILRKDPEGDPGCIIPYMQ